MLEQDNKNIFKKKYLIKNLTLVKYWLEKYIDKENTLNKLYYIILVYIVINKENINTDKNLSKYAQKKHLQLLLPTKIDINTKIIDFFSNNKIEIFKDILIYEDNINYFDKIKEKCDLYFNRFDLEIRFLPNFLKYDYTIIIIWISFCIALDKKNTNRSNNFLYDIYLFQNEKNNTIKINHLILILEKITNYIQFFDYNINDKK